MKGHIRKHRGGYRVEIHLGYDENGKRKRHVKTIKHKRAAERYLRKKLDELETEGVIRERSAESFEGYLQRWLKVAAKPRLRARGYEDYKENLKRYVFDTPLGGKPLSQVTPADLQELYGELQERIQKTRGTSGATTVRNLHKVLRTALNQAVKWREIQQSPALYVDLPRKPKPEKTVLRPSEFPAFIQSALQEERGGVMWVIALAAGPRPEEYLAFQWRDVNWSRCEIMVDRALIRPRKVEKDGPSWWFDEVKTENGRRVLELDEEVMFLLRRHQAQQAEEKLKSMGAYEDHGLIFCNELGGPLHHTNEGRRTFRRIIERAGLNPKLTPYSLRHSCATGLLEMGEDIGIVSSILGHSSSSFTFDTYVARRSHKGAAKKMGKALFGNALSDSAERTGLP